MIWPQTENDVFIPVATETIKRELYPEIDKMIKDGVKRELQGIIGVIEGL